MNNESVRINLNMDGRARIKVELNGSLREKGIKMYMGMKISHCKIDLMQSDRDMGHNSNNRREVRALVSWSVGNVVRKTLGEIVQNIRLVGLRYTVWRRHILLEIFIRVFHVSMHNWITNW